MGGAVAGVETVERVNTSVLLWATGIERCDHLSYTVQFDLFTAFLV